MIKLSFLGFLAIFVLHSCKEPSYTDGRTAASSGTAQDNSANAEPVLNDPAGSSQAVDVPVSEDSQGDVQAVISDGGETDDSTNNSDDNNRVDPEVTFAATLATPQLNLAQNSTESQMLTITQSAALEKTITLTASGLPASVQVGFSDGQGGLVDAVTINETTQAVEIEVSHEAPVSNGTMSASAPGPVAGTIQLTDSVSGEVLSTLNLGVELGNVLLVRAQDPANNGNRMITATSISVPVGVGICFVNEYKPGLRMHGAPHQPNGGMPMGTCYDKFGGGAPVQLNNLAAVSLCENADTDTMYDHDDRGTSGDISVVCQ